jgi:hypothetical protein
MPEVSNNQRRMLLTFSERKSLLPKRRVSFVLLIAPDAIKFITFGDVWNNRDNIISVLLILMNCHASLVRGIQIDVSVGLSRIYKIFFIRICFS